ncbi:MAG: PDZ domain-containing protein [Acetobacteraceae bacterium]
MLAGAVGGALACWASLGAGQAATVHSLGAVEGQLKTPQAKQYWQQQMAGKPGPDRLGVHLPPGLSAEAVAALLLPRADHAKPTLVGAKPWPGQAGRYVAIVCTGGEPFDAGAPACQRPSSGESGPGAPLPLHVYLGMLEVRPGSAPRLLARSGEIEAAIDDKIDWSLTDLPAPDGTNTDLPQSIDGFDLAPYRIAPGEPAFGLRAGWSTGYSGGSTNNTALYLFAPEDGRLHLVLAAPMSGFQDFAGKWHKNGTRDHSVTDEANILVATSNRTAGHYDLLVKAKDWNPVKQPWAQVIGVGAAVAQKDGHTRVVATVIGSPAAAAGLAVGDEVVGIEGETIDGLGVAAVRKRMNGRVGSEVRLTIRRAGRPPFVVVLRRQLVTIAPSAHLRFRWSAQDAAYRAAVCSMPCL